jgi:hypothetical protein
VDNDNAAAIVAPATPPNSLPISDMKNLLFDSFWQLKIKKRKKTEKRKKGEMKEKKMRNPLLSFRPTSLSLYTCRHFLVSSFFIFLSLYKKQ